VFEFSWTLNLFTSLTTYLLPLVVSSCRCARPKLHGVSLTPWAASQHHSSVATRMHISAHQYVLWSKWTITRVSWNGGARLVEKSAGGEACRCRTTNLNMFTFFHAVVKLNLAGVLIFEMMFRRLNSVFFLRYNRLCWVLWVQLFRVSGSIDWAQQSKLFYLSSETERSIQNVTSSIMTLDTV
jgi:hypothetical protein